MPYMLMNEATQKYLVLMGIMCKIFSNFAG